MELYDFDHDVYNQLLNIVKFRFYKQIKYTGIVFKEILSANNLISGGKFFILVCYDQQRTYYIRFKDSRVFFLRLYEIAEQRLRQLEKEEKELMKINDTEAYGENRYYQESELNAMGITSLKGLLLHLRSFLDN